MFLQGARGLRGLVGREAAAGRAAETFDKASVKCAPGQEVLVVESNTKTQNISHLPSKFSI